MVLSPLKIKNIKFVIDTFSHGGNYSWLIFLLENSLSSNYFIKTSVSRYNIYQNTVFLIGIGNDRDT